MTVKKLRDIVKRTAHSRGDEKFIKAHTSDRNSVNVGDKATENPANFGADVVPEYDRAKDNMGYNAGEDNYKDSVNESFMSKLRKYSGKQKKDLIDHSKKYGMPGHFNEAAPTVNRKVAAAGKKYGFEAVPGRDDGHGFIGSPTTTKWKHTIKISNWIDQHEDDPLVQQHFPRHDGNGGNVMLYKASKGRIHALAKHPDFPKDSLAYLKYTKDKAKGLSEAAQLNIKPIDQDRLKNRVRRNEMRARIMNLHELTGKGKLTPSSRKELVNRLNKKLDKSQIKILGYKIKNPETLRSDFHRLARSPDYVRLNKIYSKAKYPNLYEGKDSSSAFNDGFKAWADYVTNKTNTWPKNPHTPGSGKLRSWEEGASRAYEAHLNDKHNKKINEGKIKDLKIKHDEGSATTKEEGLYRSLQQYRKNTKKKKVIKEVKTNGDPWLSDEDKIHYSHRKRVDAAVKHLKKQGHKIISFGHWGSADYETSGDDAPSSYIDYTHGKTGKRHTMTVNYEKMYDDQDKKAGREYYKGPRD